MENNGTTQLNQILNTVIQILAVVIPILLFWLIRNYLKGSNAEKQVAVIVRLSNSAIDLVENFVESQEKQGQLNLPPDVSKGVHKLRLAAEWLEGELNRAGIKISDEDAKKWIESEFQKRVGEVRQDKEIAKSTRAAVDFVLKLEETKVITLPPNTDRITYLAGLAADWIVTNYSHASVTREQAVSWAQTEILQRLVAAPTTQSVQDPLMQLANAAVSFVEQLKANKSPMIRPSTSGANVESDLAIAWMLTEVAKQGLSVTPEQISQAVDSALKKRRIAQPP